LSIFYLEGDRMSIESRLRRGAAMALIALLGACATAPTTQSGDTAGLTPDEVALREQSASFVAQNVFEGAVVNAAIGCVLGAILVYSLTGEGDDAAVGCGVGGAAGAVYGGVDGYVTAKRTQAAVSELAAVRAMTADVRSENEKLARLVESSRRVAENDRRRIDALKARIDAKQMTVEQARVEAKLVRENTAQIEQVLVEARERRDNYVQARAQLAGGSETAELDGEIATLDGEIADLESQLTLVNNSLQVSGLS
jgi:hypothetical protein